MVQDQMMNRTPPEDVRAILRREVGFLCPHPHCKCPFLEYHHFDPPWHERQHHDPEGMIALCPTHHRKADNFSKERLQKFKEHQKNHPVGDLPKTLDWLEYPLVVVMGSTIFEFCPYIFAINGKPIISTHQREDGLALHVRMLTLTREPRMQMIGNDLLNVGSPEDLYAPPNGKEIRVRYANGDEFRARFTVCKNKNEFTKQFGITEFANYPVSVIQVYYKVAGTDIELGQKSTGSKLVLPGKKKVTIVGGHIQGYSTVFAHNVPPNMARVLGL
jgi:hypothetical protein